MISRSMIQTQGVVAFDPFNNNLYVANYDRKTISVISTTTNTVIGSPIRVGSEPSGIAFDSDNGNLYITNAGDGTVSALYVANYNGSSTSAINTYNTN